MHPEDAKRYLEQGFQLIAIGVDMHYLWSAAKQALEAVVGTCPALHCVSQGHKPQSYLDTKI